jgi:beta-glucanase (GH16 family)
VRRTLLLATLFLSSTGSLGRCGGSPAEPPGEDAATLIWSDEFDGPAGQSPESSKWRFDIGTGSNGWGNAQLEYDTDRPTNVSLDGMGHLAITARRESFGGSSYTSGRINTRDLFDAEQGRFEARIKLPIGQGIWPAFWMLGANFQTVGWPQCGEIDILEYRGQEPNVLHASLHGPGYSGGRAVTGSHVLPGAGFDADFHVFAVEWRTDRITWLLDGEPYQTIGPDDLPSGAPWVFDHPFFIILNVAVGGHFVGPPDETTSFPQTMLVDWVRVSRFE